MQDKMKCVLAVYQEKSFSRAAEKLFVSQTVVSKTVKQVETELGVPLFDRSTIPLSLTTEGATYIKYARQILHLEEEMTECFGDIRELKTGNLTIGGSSFFCSFVLPPIMSAFSVRYPDVSIKLREANYSVLRAGLEDESIDLIIETAVKNTDPTLRTFYSHAENIVLAVPASNRINVFLKGYQLDAERLRDDDYMSQVAAVPLNKFAPVDFVLLNKGSDLLPRAFSMCREAGFTPRIKLQVDQILTATNLCAAGMGATFTRPDVVRCCPHMDEVCFYRLSSEKARRNIYFASKGTRHINNVMMAFLQMAVKDFSI